MNNSHSTPTFPWDRFRASWKHAETLLASSRNPEAADYVLAGRAMDEDPALRATLEGWYRASPEYRAGVERDITTFLSAPVPPAK